MGSFSSFDYEYPLDRDPKFLSGGFHPYFGDPTWKERHAKGVPASMGYNEHSKLIRLIDNQIDNRLGFVYSWRGTTRQSSIGVHDDDYNVFARYCNFRYKPEWLEKKGQTNN